MDPAEPALASVPSRELEAQITELAGHLTAANHRWLVLIAEFDRRQAWSDGGLTKSCAHWLSWKCGLDLGAAREKVRVARALETLPAISAAMSTGQVSYSKARALTRVATPATESELLNVAVYGSTHHVERIVREFRRIQEVEALSREQRQFEHRGLSYHHDEDGALIVKLRLTAETGALFLRAVDAALPEVPLPDQNELVQRVSAETSSGDSLIDGEGALQGSAEMSPNHACEDAEGKRHVSAETSPADGSRDCEGALHVSGETSETHPPVYQERPPSYGQRRADALMVLVESYLAHGPQSLKGGERQQIVVHVDEATLKDHAQGRCELDEGPAIPVETARRLSCDASKVVIVEDERGEPLDVGRRTRTIPPALRRALKSRDQGCVFPGCTHQRYVDGHHIEHWAEGGETKLSNLVSLCRFHHRAVHEGGMRVERCDDGAWRFIRKSGDVIGTTTVPGRTLPLSHWTVVPKENAERGIVITPKTAATKWGGERMDYGIAIDSLLYRTKRAATAHHNPLEEPTAAGGRSAI